MGSQIKNYDTFMTLNEDLSSPLVITAEHAGNLWPKDIEIFGMPSDWQEQHYAYDRGVRDFAILLSQELRCPLVLGKYSRILIDLNRVPGAEDIIKTSNDGVAFPMNENPLKVLDQRFDKYYVPYHTKVRELLSRQPNKTHICIHSYIQQKMTDNVSNPWHLGVQYPVMNPIVRSALDFFLKIEDAVVADNLPYDLRKGLPGSISLHAAAFGMNTVELEFRDDQLTDPVRALFWQGKTLSWLEHWKHH
jgi:predicted N-formylglutamate amidohydrolase